MTDVTRVFEIEFQEANNPKGLITDGLEIGPAFAFMQGITGEMHVSEMTFRNHAIEPGGFAQFLNHLSSRQMKTLEENYRLGAKECRPRLREGEQCSSLPSAGLGNSQHLLGGRNESQRSISGGY